MDIEYRKREDYKAVDIKKLRPKGSYEQLIKKRTHSIDELVRKHGKIPDDLLIDRNCPICDSKNNSGELSKDYMQIVRCKVCDLVYVDPIFNQEHYDKIYRSEDYQDIVRELGEASHLYRLERFGEERVNIMERFINNKKNQPTEYLDVGCSTGFVVEAAQKRGWRATGIDLNPSAIDFGKKRGLQLQNIRLDSPNFQSNSFDAISLFDVLEHLVEPRQTLERTWELLRENGIVFLYVPNYDSASRFLMGKEAHFIWPTHHLTYFTPQTLIKLIQQVGFEPVFVATEGLDLIDFMWYQKEQKNADVSEIEKIADDMQFFINAGGYGKNLRLVGKKKKINP